MSRKRALLIIVLLIFVSYGNALLNDFTGDAKGLFKNNTFYKKPSNILKVFTNDFVMKPENITGSLELEAPSSSGFISYRPVTALFFFSDYALWKNNAFGHHLTNLLLHALTSIFVYLLLIKLTKEKEVSLLAGLLFAVHPIHSEVVCNIGYRSDLVSTFFYLLALLLYFCAFENECRNKLKLLCLSSSSFFLALFSKETALTLPVVLFFLDFWFLKKEGEATKEFLRSRMKIYLCFLSILAFYIFIYFFVMQNVFYSKMFAGTENVFDKLVLASNVFLKYLVAFILPFKVNVLPTVYSPVLKIGGIAAVILAIVLVAFDMMVAKSMFNKKRYIAFFILWFLVTFLPVSNLLRLLNPYAFRFMYLPSIGLLAVFAYIILALIDILKKRMKSIRSGLIIKMALIGLCMSITISNNAFFKNSIVAAEEMIRNYPESSRAYWILGVEYFELGRLRQADRYFNKYLEIDPKNPQVLDPGKNFSVYYLLGMCNVDDAKKSISYFEKVISLKPDYVLAYLSLAEMYKRNNDFDKAQQMLSKAEILLEKTFR